jgi:hypothetical protein
VIRRACPPSTSPAIAIDDAVVAVISIFTEKFKIFQSYVDRYLWGIKTYTLFVPELAGCPSDCGVVAPDSREINAPIPALSLNLLCVRISQELNEYFFIKTFTLIPALIKL